MASPDLDTLERFVATLRDLLAAERQASLDPTSEPVTLDQLDRLLHAVQVDFARHR